MSTDSLSVFKQCSTCKSTKPHSEFYRSRANKDRLSYTCKECTHKREKLWREQNPDMHRRKKRRWRDANRQQERDRHKQQRERFPEKQKARRAAHYALTTNRLVMPDQCESCGKDTKLTMHHYRGYEEEHWLAVEFLCGDCHVS